MRLSIGLIFIALVFLGRELAWADGYCLSGGYRSAYSCDDPLRAHSRYEPPIYTVQLLEQGAERLLSGRDDVVHSVLLAEDQRLVYLGRYRDESRALKALDQAFMTWGPTRRPLLVQLTPHAVMPRIRLVAEPDIALAGGVSEVVASARNKIVASARNEVAQLAAPAVQYSQVYSIQTAAFGSASLGQAFAERHPQLPFSCRVRSNGLFAVYYGVYESYADGKQHLQDYPLLTELGAYVVKLKNVSFKPCETLAAQIEQSRKQAYRNRECADCDSKALSRQYLPNLSSTP